MAHSLISRVDGSHPARYRILDSVALAAGRRLTDSGRRFAVERHREFMLELARAVVDGSAEASQEQARCRLDRELANVRQALAQCGDAPDAVARLMVDSYSWWATRGQLQSAHKILWPLMEQAVPADPALRHRFYRTAAEVAVHGGSTDDLPDILALLDDVDALGAMLGRPPLLGIRALAVRLSGDLERAIEIHRREADANRNAGVSGRSALANIAVANTLLGRFDDARAAALAAMAEAEAHGETTIDASPIALAQAELAIGNHAGAAEVATDWLARINGAGSQPRLSHQVEAMMVIAMAELALDRHDVAAAHMVGLLPLATRLGGVHLRMALLVAAAAAISFDRPHDAERLLEAAEEDAEVRNRPERAMVIAHFRRRTGRPPRAIDGGPPTTVDALRIAHDVVKDLG